MTLVSLLGKWMVHQTPFNHRPHQCHGCSCKNRCPEHTVTIDFSRGSPMPENDFNDSFEGYKVECLSYINDALWQCLSFLKTRHLIIKQRPFCVCLGRKAEGAGNWEKTQWSSEWWVSFCFFSLTISLFIVLWTLVATSIGWETCRVLLACSGLSLIACLAFLFSRFLETRRLQPA